jgi:hypothetical protein
VSHAKFNMSKVGDTNIDEETILHCLQYIWLTLHVFKGPFLRSFNSLRSTLPRVSHSPLEIETLYSASVVDLDTTVCFLLLHETRFPPTNTQ